MRTFVRTASALAVGSMLLIGTKLIADDAAAPKALFSSAVITADTAGHAVDIDVDVTGATQLFLVVTEGGDGYASDWADWAEPRLVGSDGEKKLTDLTWKSTQEGWGKTNVGKNANGDALKIDGKEVAYGIGTHAPSLIVYDLPAGTTRFKARGGLDEGGTAQQPAKTSVRFMIYTQQPPDDVLKNH